MAADADKTELQRIQKHLYALRQQSVEIEQQRTELADQIGAIANRMSFPCLKEEIVTPTVHQFPDAITSGLLSNVAAIPTTLTAGSTTPWIHPDTGVEVYRISDGSASGDQGVYVSKGSYDLSGAYFMLQDGTIRESSPPFTVVRNTTLATNHSAWSRVYPNFRYGRSSSNLFAGEDSSGNVQNILDQNGNTIPMTKLGDSKGDIAANDSLIAVDNGLTVNLYEMTGQYTANLLGSIDADTGYTNYNGALPSPDGRYVVMYDNQAPTMSTRLYDKNGNFIKNIFDGRSQHGDWGVDNLGRSVWIAHAAETPIYYIPDTDQYVATSLDLMSGDMRFGNGFVTGQNWPQDPGYGFVATGEDTPDFLTIRFKLSFSDANDTRTLTIPNSNGGASTQLTVINADPYAETWYSAPNGSDEITAGPDSQCIIADIGPNEVPHLVCCPGYTEENFS